MTRRSGPWWLDVSRGAIAGGVGTWLMDMVTTGLQADQPQAEAAQEQAAAPGGKSSVENLVDRLGSRLGMELDGRTRGRAIQAVHYGLGVVPGALYALARRRLPLVAAGGGVAYGIALWAVNDEWLNASLGLSGPPEAYPAATHVRGFVGHAVLGGGTETALILLGG